MGPADRIRRGGEQKHRRQQKVSIGSDLKLKATGTKVSKLTVDPVLVGFGFGWKF